MIFENYYHIFYLTVAALDWIEKNLVLIPFIKLLQILNVSGKRIETVKKMHLTRKNNLRNSGNSSHAISFMLMSLTFLIILIELIILWSLNKFEDSNLAIPFIIACFLSGIINWEILWKNTVIKNILKS